MEPTMSSGLSLSVAASLLLTLGTFLRHGRPQTPTMVRPMMVRRTSRSLGVRRWCVGADEDVAAHVLLRPQLLGRRHTLYYLSSSTLCTARRSPQFHNRIDNWKMLLPRFSWRQHREKKRRDDNIVLTTSC